MIKQSPLRLSSDYLESTNTHKKVFKILYRVLGRVYDFDFLVSVSSLDGVGHSYFSYLSSDSSEGSMRTPVGQVILFDHFYPDDPAQDSSLDSTSDASSDFHSDASSDSFSRHSLSDHSSLDLPSTSAGPSLKRRRSPMTSVPALPHVSEALSPVRADLIPSPKRVRDFGYLADVEVDPRETSLRDDVMIRGSDKPHLQQDIDPEIQTEIDECIAYADALGDRGIDVRVVVEAVDREESETGTRVLVEVRVERVTLPIMLEDALEPAQEERAAIEGVQMEQGCRIVGVESIVTALTERIAELERDNRRLRGTVIVKSQRVDRQQRDMSRMQRVEADATISIL
nr:hypothetical protein [Tanacetum cinerariifolium]